MSHQLPDEYWESLGPNGLFLHELFHNQSQLVKQLQVANNDLQTQIRERTSCAQLHALRMTPGMTAEEYMANFEMISGRTGFNDATLEDAYV